MPNVSEKVDGGNDPRRRFMWKIIRVAVVLQAARSSTYALAQAQPQMPMMDVQMTWPMVIGCGLVVLVLILAIAALIKYLVFR